VETVNRSILGAACWLRRLALAVSSLAAAFWLLILLDILACDAIAGFVCVSWENVLLLGIAAASMLAVFVAWRQAGLGGLALVVWGVAFTTFAYLTSGPRPGFSMLVSGVPFLVGGLLLLGSWFVKRAVPNQASVPAAGRS
jgi:hypothetical protein